MQEGTSSNCIHCSRCSKKIDWHKNAIMRETQVQRRRLSLPYLFPSSQLSLTMNGNFATF